MKFHRSVPPYVQQLAQDLLAYSQLAPPRTDRFLALVGANNRADQRLVEFYGRLAESDPAQVKKFIMLFVMLDLDFALQRTDDEIREQKELIPKIQEAALKFIRISSEYLNHLGFSTSHSLTGDALHIDLPNDYLEEVEGLRKAVLAIQQFLSRFQSHSPHVDPFTEFVLDSRKKTPRTRQIRQLIQLFFEEKIELRTRSIPIVLSLGLQIIGDEDLEMQQVANLFSDFSKRFNLKKSTE